MTDQSDLSPEQLDTAEVLDSVLGALGILPSDARCEAAEKILGPVCAMARRTAEAEHMVAAALAYADERERIADLERKLAEAKALIDEMQRALERSESAPHTHPLDPQQRAAQRIDFRRRRAALDVPEQAPHGS